MPLKRGIDFKLYLNTDTPYDSSPTWAEVKNVGNLNRALDKVIATIQTRANEFDMEVGVRKTLEVEFEMPYDPADTLQARIYQAWWTEENLEFAILDGGITTNGSSGIRFMAVVKTFPGAEDIADVGRTTITLGVAYVLDNLPRRVTVTGGVLTNV